MGLVSPGVGQCTTCITVREGTWDESARHNTPLTSVKHYLHQALCEAFSVCDLIFAVIWQVGILPTVTDVPGKMPSVRLPRKGVLLSSTSSASFKSICPACLGAV